MLSCLVNIRLQINTRLNCLIKKIWHNYYHNVQLCDSQEYNRKLFAFNKMEVQIIFHL